MFTRKSLICAILGTVLVVCATIHSQAGQANLRLGLSDTAINAAMLSSFDATQQRVSPTIIGEVTLPGLLVNGGLLGGNNGPGINDPAIVHNFRNGPGFSLVPEPPAWSMVFLGGGLLLAAMRFRQHRGI